MFFERDLLTRISAEEMRLQYKEFVRRMEELNEEVDSLDSTALFSLFLDPQNNLYKGIEAVLAVMANSGLVMGLESVVESWVSVMEHHNNPKRCLSQQRLENELMIAVNGPTVAHCDSVVDEAIDLYWSKAKRVGERGGHWIRKSDNIRSFITSKAVDSLVNEKPEVPFML